MKRSCLNLVAPVMFAAISAIRADEPIPPPKPVPSFDEKEKPAQPLPDVQPPKNSSTDASGRAATGPEKLAVTNGPTPLTLEEVLGTVDQHFPLLAAVEQERAIAQGQQISAEGAFDTNFTGSSINAPPGNTFENYRINTGITQFTGLGGMSYSAGYRVSAGTFPVYYGDRKTGDGGEFRAGLNIPLMRDKDIDRRRATLSQAGINRQIAEPVIRRQRLDVQRSASRAYWAWLAMGRRMAIAEQLLETAKERDAGLQGRVEAGALAKIERTDNLRTIAEREARLVAAQRRFQAAAIDLSLFLRDPDGQPCFPPASRLPRFPDPVPFDANKCQEAIDFAWNTRPELERFRLNRERIFVDLQLATNQTLPGLNATFYGARDVGPGNKVPNTPKAGIFDLDAANLEAALIMEMPVQRRDARGKVLVAKAQLAQIAQQERYARDQIGVEIRDLLNALQRAYELREQTRQAVRLAREVLEGERTKFDVGTSTILNVNLRELTAFEAELTEIDALFEYFRAFTDYQAALGYDVARVGGK